MSPVLPAMALSSTSRAKTGNETMPTFHESLMLPIGAMTGAASSETVFIVEIVLLLLVGRVIGELMRRLGQPAVIGQLIGGVLLGPSLFGWVWPSAQHLIFPAGPEQKSMINAISELG